MKAVPPPPEEVERARTQLISQRTYARDSIEQQAEHIGSLENIGLSWRLMEQEIDQLNQVAPEDIQRVATTFLTRQRLTTAHVLMETTDE